MLRELYLQDLVLVPWESFPVPRTVVYQSGHWMEAAAGDCVSCALSKPFTCLGSPRGSCGGSAASLTPEGEPMPATFLRTKVKAWPLTHSVPGTPFHLLFVTNPP